MRKIHAILHVLTIETYRLISLTAILQSQGSHWQLYLQNNLPFIKYAVLNFLVTKTIFFNFMCT